MASGIIVNNALGFTIDGDLTEPVAAQGTLTMATNPTDADTVTVDTKVYTFLDTLTGADGEVSIGASATDTQVSLVAAFDLSGSAGADYGASMTAHTSVDIAAFATNDAVLTAQTAGTAGDAIATTSSLSASADGFDAVTLGTTTAGVDPSTLNAVMPMKGQFTTAYGAVGTAPVSSDLLVDIHVEGTTVFSTQTNRITIADGDTDGSAAAFDDNDFEAGDVLEIFVDQIGSGTAGSDLTVTIGYKGDTSP